MVAQTVKHLPTMRETRFQSLGGKMPWKRKWQPAPVFLPGKSHGWMSLVGYSPWGHRELDTTERLHFYFLFTVYKIRISIKLHPKKLSTYSELHLFVCINSQNLLKSRKNEGMQPKQKHYPVVNVTGDRNKVGCCKE